MYYLEASPKTWSSLSEREYRSVLPGPRNRGFRLESDRFAPTPLPFTWKWSLLWKLSCKCLLVLLACRWRSLLLFRVMAGNRVIISGNNPPKSFCGGSQFRLIFVQSCLTKAPCLWAVKKKPQGWKNSKLKKISSNSSSCLSGKFQIFIFEN